MQTPILAYFLAVGVVLFGGMRLVSSQNRFLCRKGSVFQHRSKPH
jgi:hypothetical protein